MRRRSKFDFFVNDLLDRSVKKPEHICEKEGCCKPAEFRAPKDRALKEYYWFCLEHVKEYNAQWDYYAGMSASQIEEELKQDVCWQRPTWKLGQCGKASSLFSDPLGMQREAFGAGQDAFSQKKGCASQHADPALIAAAKILEVAFPLEVKDVRLNYKRLAKTYHPDSNGGDKKLEEKFKDITQAYRLIMSVLNSKK